MARFGIFKSSALYHGTSVENMSEVTPQNGKPAFATPDLELAMVHGAKHGIPNARVYKVKPKKGATLKPYKSLDKDAFESDLGFDVVKEVKNEKNWWK